jgi:hypothetical protein
MNLPEYLRIEQWQGPCHCEKKGSVHMRNRMLIGLMAIIAILSIASCAEATDWKIRVLVPGIT